MVIKTLLKAFVVNLMILVIIFLVLAVCSGCSHGREYRVYVHDARRGLFIRDLENKEVLTYEEGHGLICMPETEVRKIMEQVATDKAYEGKKK